MGRVFLLLLLPFLSFGQQDSLAWKIKEEHRINRRNQICVARAGYFLNRHHKTFILGFGLEIGGAVVMAASPMLGMGKADNNGLPLLIIGGILSLIGGIVQVASDADVGKAGRIMMNNGHDLPMERMETPVHFDDNNKAHWKEE